MSGFCESLADRAMKTCSDAACDALFPWTVYTPLFNIIRSESSKWCVSNVTTIEMSGTYEAEVGFHETAATLNAVSALVGSHALTTSTVTQIQDVRDILGDETRRGAITKRLYEVAYFGFTNIYGGKVNKRDAEAVGPGPVGVIDYIDLANGTIIEVFLAPYDTPWAAELPNTPGGRVVYQLNGQVYFPIPGFYDLNIIGGGTYQLKINGSVAGADDFYVGKRDAYESQAAFFPVSLEFAGGWVPFEITGYFSFPWMADLEFYVDGVLVGFRSGNAVRTFSLDTPVPAAYTYQWLCDNCVGGKK